MQEGYNQNQNAENENQNESQYAFRTVVNENKKNRRTWSVLSLIFAIASVCTLYFSVVGLTLALFAIAFAIVSRKRLGYFDKLSLAGIIIGVFGCVFGLTGMIFGEFIANLLN